MDKPVELTLEEKFSIVSFETQVAKMSEAQAKEFLVKLHEQMILKDVMYRHLFRQQWGG